MKDSFADRLYSRLKEKRSMESAKKASDTDAMLQQAKDLNELWKAYHPDKWQYRDDASNKIKKGLVEVSDLLSALMEINKKGGNFATITKWPSGTNLPEEITLPLPGPDGTFTELNAPLHGASPSQFFEVMKEFTKDPHGYLKKIEGG